MQRRIGLAVLIGALLAWADVTSALTLASNGQSKCVIVVPDHAMPPELTGAKELQSHLEVLVGVELPIQTESEALETTPQIVVGPGARFRAALPDVDLASLGHDGIVMKTVSDNLYLAGGRPRGTLYAVYTFLEDVAGVRWWTGKDVFIPRNPDFEVPPLDVVYVPKLRYREAYYRGAFDGVFAARSKCNGHFEQVPPEYGGHYSILGWCHTFNQLLPPDQYFKDHPEWYSEIGGTRVPDKQLCLTNDAMRAELVRKALEWLRKDPGAGIISIAQNDCGGNCECARCAAVEKEEGAPSGLIIRFVNAVAEEIEKEFPDTLVETLAYSYTRQAPKLAKPRKNVLVRLCSIECSFSQPLGTGPQNADFKRDIEAWSAIAPQLYIWDYVTNFRNYILPHPNLRVLAPNIRFFVDHRAVGLFEQGDAGSSCGDFVELRAWLLAHLMWDPSRDDKALIAEFLQGYYGAAAAGPIQQYIDLTHDAVEHSGAPLRCYMEDTAPWLSLDDMNRAVELFRQAQKAVEGNPELTQRVRRARLPLDHAWLQRYHALKRISKAGGKPFLGPEDSLAFCEDFVTTANAFDVGQYAEGAPFEAYAEALRSRFRTAAPAPELCAKLPEENWVDIQDNEFRLSNTGTWAAIVDDPKASDQKAARMPGNHVEWAVQYAVSGDLSVLNPAHCYIVARCEATVAAGPAFQMGLYDAESRAAVAQQTIVLEESGKGEYRAYDLGVHDLKPSMYFWVAPVGRPDGVNAVFVDRIFCVKERH